MWEVGLARVFWEHGEKAPYFQAQHCSVVADLPSGFLWSCVLSETAPPLPLHPTPVCLKGTLSEHRRWAETRKCANLSICRLHLLVLLLFIWKKNLIFFLLFYSWGHSHVGPLFTNEKLRKVSSRSVWYLGCFVGHVQGVSDTDCSAQNDSTHCHVFAMLSLV